MLKKIICITGATGFIGTDILKKIDKKKFKIRVVTRNKLVKFDDEIEVIYGDLTKNDFPFEEFLNNSDCLLNCMGQIQNNKNLFISNVKSVSLLIQNLKKRQKSNKIFHWIQISSSGVYGANLMSFSDEIDINENSECSPKNPYEKSKYQADLIIKETSNNNKLFKYTILRPTAVCDKEMPNQSLNNLIKLIKIKRFFYIGRPNSIANYIHRDDFTNAILLSLYDPKAYNETYIVSSDCYWEEIINQIIYHLRIKYNIFRLPYSIGFVYVFLYKILIYKLKILPNLENLMSRTRYENTKITKELGFKLKKNVPNLMKELISNILTV